MEVPIHKAAEDENRIIKSLCEPGFYQVADEWSNVTCERCLARKPEEFAEGELITLIGLMRVEMGRFPTEAEVTTMIFGTEEERVEVLRHA